MKIQDKNNIIFTGIRLYNSSFEYSKGVHDKLEKNGIHVVGHKTYYVNNELKDKQKITRYVRSKYNFHDNECGVLFFPWSKEAWLIGRPAFEQKLLKILHNLEIKSAINLFI